MKSGFRVYVNGPTVIEWESKAKIGRLPIISLGANAKGVVAIGTRAQGVLAMGVFCRGIFSLGVLSMGVFSFGALSLGVLSIGALAAGLLAAGGIAAGIITAGAVALGMMALGAVTLGCFTNGALSLGFFIAIGDYARSSMIALGRSFAEGKVFEHLGPLSAADAERVRDLLDRVVPPALSLFGEIFKNFV